MIDTPETDELARSLLYERLASTETCYYEMRMLSRKLEQKFNSERALADRLHGALDALDYNLAFAENTAHGSLGEKITAMRAIALPAIEAWKEARND